MVVNRGAYCQGKHRILSKRGCIRSFRRYVLKPNATHQPLPEAGARHERTLEAVGCRRLFGEVPVLCVPASGVPCTPIG